MSSLKTFLYKLYFSLALTTDQNISFADRIQNLIVWVCSLAPVVYILENVTGWMVTNQGFVIAVVTFIFVNMILGGYMHHRKGDFDWKKLLRKTNQMLLVLFLSYFTLEVLLTIAGKNVVVEFFRIAVQVSTLLYPGSKILKNIFILSDGQHPPKWVMEKIYNFKETGDLHKLFETKTEQNGK